MSAERFRRSPWFMVAVAVLLSVVASTSVSWAGSNYFSDVNGGFESQIDAIAEAGCATGFNDGTFRPKDGTTRGQFAFWMNNCGGRAAYAAGHADFPNATPATIAETFISAGAAGAGGGFAVLKLNLQGSGGCTGAGCQVDVNLEVKELNDAFFVPVRSVTLDFFPNGPAANHQPNGSAGARVSLQAGDELQIRAVGTLNTGGTDNPRIYGDLTVTTFPFDGQGNGNPIF